MPCILLADHDPTTRSFLAMKLREAGYEVDVADNGHEAIIRLSTHRHSLVISCYAMRGKNGLEFLREIRQSREYDTIPFILFTEVDPRSRTDNKNYANLMQEIEALGAVLLPKTAENFRRFPIAPVAKQTAGN